MKLSIRQSEAVAVNAEKEVELYLEMDGSEVDLRAKLVGQEDEDSFCLLTVQPNGKVSGISGVSNALGFNLDKENRIKLTGYGI